MERTQNEFATLVGCSGITIQRIENGTLPLSRSLANRILQATGASPRSLLNNKTALDLKGRPYTKEFYDIFTNPPLDPEANFAHYADTASVWTTVLLAAAHRSPRRKLTAVFVALADSLQELADDFDLKDHIQGLLKEHGSVRIRRYLVRDLRRFPEYARSLPWTDSKEAKPDEQVRFEIPDGWITPRGLVVETPVLPKDAPKEYRENDYQLDMNRPMSKELRDYLNKTEMLWRIRGFWAHCDDPIPEPPRPRSQGNPETTTRKFITNLPLTMIQPPSEPT